MKISHFLRTRSTLSFGIVVMVLAVFLGTLDWIPASQERLLVDGTGDYLAMPSAVHPQQPLHMERSTLAKHFWAPVRLHQARAKSPAFLSGAVSIAPPGLRSFLLDSPDLAAAGASHRPISARAPPFA